uniref:Uncharacterized protein n=1 Tax=Arundo donax TaxID=35708 RepID=A0A0A9B173_ARUDO
MFFINHVFGLWSTLIVTDGTLSWNLATSSC